MKTISFDETKYQLVPIEPTSKIKSAMCCVLLDDKEAQFCYDLTWEEATELYKTAMAAARSGNE